MSASTTNNLTSENAPRKIPVVEPRVWKDIRHPVTQRLFGKYCPQTQQLELVDRRQRAVIKLPS